MAFAVMGAVAPAFQPHVAACAPTDYADLMDELMSCRTPEAARLWRYGTVARRHALPQPWQNAVNAALVACERVDAPHGAAGVSIVSLAQREAF